MGIPKQQVDPDTEKLEEWDTSYDIHCMCYKLNQDQREASITPKADLVGQIPRP